uniref:Secreted protein n=1 Tax=Phakopsora pachyrhizi TaxID=170000 RepID=A0A0S1MIF2_PHAPC
MQTKILLALCLVAISQVNAHGAITAVQGSNGMTGEAFGVDQSTPRDGTKRNPFQTDSSIIRDREIASGKSSACGRTLAGGNNEIGAAMSKAESAGIPSVSSDGKVQMTLHQVNGDGGGPYTCDVNASGDGKTFTPMTISTNIPGKNSRSNAKAEDIPLIAEMPKGMTCTGGSDGQTCIVRCRNAANAGPFGGCVAVTQATDATKQKRELSAEQRIDEMIKQDEDAELAEENLSKRELTADQRLDEMIKQAEAAEIAEENLVKRELTADQRLDEMIKQAEAAELAEENLAKRELTADQRLDQMIKQAEDAELAEESLSKRELTADQRLDEMIKQAEAAEIAEENLAKRELTAGQRLDEMIKQAEAAELAEELI